jgi:hypothetical protein
MGLIEEIRRFDSPQVSQDAKFQPIEPEINQLSQKTSDTQDLSRRSKKTVVFSPRINQRNYSTASERYRDTPSFMAFNMEDISPRQHILTVMLMVAAEHSVKKSSL